MLSVRRWVSLVLAVAVALPVLLAAGCAARDGEDVPGAIDTLAAGGVAVYDSYTGAPVKAIAGQRSAMRFTQFQVRTLLRQAKSGMGMSGAQIDAIGAAKWPKHAATFSQLLAAWLKRGGSPLAVYAASLTKDKVDVEHASHMIFPTMTVMLFIGDMARLPGAAPAGRTGFEWERLIAAPAAASGLCSSVTNFVDGITTDVYNALQSAGVPFLASLWGFAITIVKGVINATFGQILGIIKSIAGALAMITLISSSLSAWTVEMEMAPDQVDVDENSNQGKVIAHVHTEGIDWPSQLADCANVLGGVDLTNISYRGAEVTWTEAGNFKDDASVDSEQALVGDDAKATLAYHTYADQSMPKKECSYKSQTDVLYAIANVQRKDIQKLEDALVNLAFGALPGPVAAGLKALLGSTIQDAETRLQEFIAMPALGVGEVVVYRWHLDNTKCTPAPSGSPGPSAQPQSSATPDGRDALVGTWNCETTVTTTAVKEFGAVDVKVALKMHYTKDMAWMEYPKTSHFGQDVHHVAADDNTGTSSKYAYTYTPNDDHNGVLSAAGRDQKLHFSDPNHFTFSAQSMYNGVIHYACAR